MHHKKQKNTPNKGGLERPEQGCPHGEEAGQTITPAKLKGMTKVAPFNKTPGHHPQNTLLDSIFKVDLSKDLKKHDKEIKFFLENEFISRKHFQKGRMEASVKQDPYIEQAIGVFKNTTKYHEILGIN